MDGVELEPTRYLDGMEIGYFSNWMACPRYKWWLYPGDVELNLMDTSILAGPAISKASR